MGGIIMSDFEDFFFSDQNEDPTAISPASDYWEQLDINGDGIADGIEVYEDIDGDGIFDSVLYHILFSGREKFSRTRAGLC